MAAFIKVDDFQLQLANGVHDFDAHTFKLALTDTAPTPGTDQSYLEATTAPDPAAANGYTALGHTLSVTTTEAAGVSSIKADEIVYTATAGGIGPFRYVLMYNDTATTPVDALVGYWDYGSSITLADTETFTATFNATPTAGTIATIT